MNDSQLSSNSIDFGDSQFSQMSKYDFEKNAFEGDEKSIIDACNSQAEFSDTPQVNKKLYVKDLQINKQGSDKSKQSNKQNNIPNQQPSTQSRRIIIHKNVSPYRVDESFSTTKIVQLQEEMIQLRKEMPMKEGSWIKEKTVLMNKLDIAGYDLAEMRQRNNNLIQINQTLTQALGQSSKSTVSQEYEKKLEQVYKQLQAKTKKINALQQTISKLQREKCDISLKLKQSQQSNQTLQKSIHEYKAILQQSNQRKFMFDEKLVVFNKNIEALKMKLNQLPIKNEYLHPIFAFLDSMKQGGNQQQPQSSFQLQISQVKKAQQHKFFRADNKPKYKQNQSFLKPQQPKHPKPQYQQYSNYSNPYHNEQPYQQGQTPSPFIKHNYKTYNPNIQRIDTDQQNQYYEGEESSNDYRQQQEEEVYLCEICQRVYPYQEFQDHMEDCRQYEQLLKQKKAIESKLISIKEQEYDNARKSNISSLNTSVVILNKSKSRGKVVNRPQMRPSHQRRDTSARNNNGNKTQRYIQQKDDSSQNSRLQLSQLLNISGISNRQSNVFHKGFNPKPKKGYINPANYFTAGQNYQESQQNNFYVQNKQNHKPKPEIKYQTNMPEHHYNNVGKESMQEEIRKIVEQLNGGNLAPHRVSKGGNVQMRKQSSKEYDQQQISARGRANTNHPIRQEGNPGNRNQADKTNRNRAEFY